MSSADVKDKALLKQEAAGRAIGALIVDDDRAVPLLPWGMRVEDRRPAPEMQDRDALLMLTLCQKCGQPFVFITSERDTCNYSTVCGRCSKSHT